MRVRSPRGGGAELVLAHAWVTLEPGSEEHFRACLARLHRLGFVPG
ncbi:MAG: hypothetical protein AB1758_02785 [Candidatus Eremiobacterota bacterium]